MTTADKLIWERHLALKNGDEKELERITAELEKVDFMVIDSKNGYRILGIKNEESFKFIKKSELEERFKNVK